MRSMPQRKNKSGSHWGWWLLVLLVIAGLLVYFKYPSLLYLPFTGEQSGTSMNVWGLKAICSANVSYQYAHPKQGYAASLQELGPQGAQYIDMQLATGEKSGYRYQYTPKRAANGLIEGYAVSARPLVKSGGRSYFSDDGCEIHWTGENRAATAADPKL
jgi:hypothetical protein